MLGGSRGFTLVETLVAAVILFAVLTSALLSFQNSVLASSKAESQVRLISAVPALRARIGRQLRNFEASSGEGNLGELNFSWVARVRLEGDALDVREAGEGGVGLSVARSFTLWDVGLVVSLGGSSKQYNFSS
jgi:type II secretory pathway pseudopilin PulG